MGVQEQRAAVGRGDHQGRGRTSRSRASRSRCPSCAGSGGSRALRRASTPSSGLLERGQGRADRGGRRPHRRGRVRRPVPDRRVPDRLGHLVEHERQRGDRRRSPAKASHAERRRQHGPVLERRVPVRRPPGGARRSATDDLLPALERLRRRCSAKADEFEDVVKSGRTHLMDAVPVTLGQEFGGYAAQVRARREADLDTRCRRSAQIPLGGTATGTGLNTHPEFATRVRARLDRPTGPRDPPAGGPVRGPGQLATRSSSSPVR